MVYAHKARRSMATPSSENANSRQWLEQIQAWARELGFSQVGVSGIDLESAEPYLLEWLAEGYHGDMHYMERHGLKRARPAELVPGTLSVITVRMPYLPRNSTGPDWQTRELSRLENADEGVVSLYARGRDYHKVVRGRLRKLCDRIEALVGPFGHRVFSDSAPVLEKELAVRSGQGWRGKHSLVLSRDGGSMFFLGEILVDFALEPTEPVSAHCGSCSACIDVCPTGAIVAPGVVDARRCISYLTIENHGPIPEEFRPLMGNRVYGCDDCQLICPWNKYAQTTELPDFDERSPLVGQQLVELFAWDEATFLKRTEGGRFGALTMNGGYATLLWLSVMPYVALTRGRRKKYAFRCSAAQITPAPWCVNTLHGPWRSAIRFTG